MTTRTAINPTSWSINLGFDQAQLVEGHQRLLVCSGRDGFFFCNAQHPGDVHAQLDLTLDNLEDVLAAADMTLANIVRLSVYTTEFDELVTHWAGLTGAASGTPTNGSATSLLGVTPLLTPEGLVMLETTAVA